MPTEVTQPEVQQPTSQPQGLPPEVKQMMEASLGMTQPQTQPLTEVQPAATPATEVAQPAVEIPTATDFFSPLKEKFGYQNLEDAVKEIESLRHLKANPTPAQIKFENELSEKIFKAVQEGKVDPLYEHLHEQKRLDKFLSLEVNNENAADIIKLGMALKYKDLNLSDDEINFKYNQQFALPAEPRIKDDETDEDFAVRKQEWQDKVSDINMTKVIEAKLLKPELEAHKGKLVFPELNQFQPEQEYLDWKKSMENTAKVDAETAEAYSKLTPDNVLTNIDFKDEANKVAFQFQFKPDDASFKDAITIVSDFDKFFDRYKNEDGTYRRNEFLQDIHLILNKNKVLTEAMNQAKNATIKSLLPDNVNGGGLVRQLPQGQEPTELQQYMSASLSV